MRVPERLAELLDTFNSITEPDERSMLLIGYSERFHEVPSTVALRPFPEANRVAYCESEAYVWAIDQPDGTLKLYFAVENPSGISAKALAAIMDETLSGSAPEVIAHVSTDIVEQIFRQNISMGKGMGLMSMVQQVQALAQQRIESHQRKMTSG